VFRPSGSRMVAVDGMDLADDAQAIVFNGRPCRSRTCDQRIKSIQGFCSQ
jgi:hypothetical protein